MALLWARIATTVLYSGRSNMSLTRIFAQRRVALERYIRRVLRNPDDAADVSQEAFLRVYAAELGHATPVSEALLFTVARNLALSELRKRTARATDAHEDMSALGFEAPGANPEGIVSDRQLIQAVERAMTRMSPRCLEVFRLRKVEGLPHSEIAERLEISSKTVERHISQALRLCHEALIESSLASPRPVRNLDGEAA
jgi:RNA polymerase sigma-70 factor (ECF subfamily)